ncbi:4'-phosphopantetheinyl transferase family protein [Winogradskyella helgolandensis]|uniref:4'-phosphopantetheinyl transferase family protein n=1 Tax=Winogradskyella helgolandensis TaxID=2697010 RepID=UPI0015C939EE|nr:4'-phosphopantetheinyl transferase superfamily protein [Winogradskyella helgolandensis]
MMEYNNSESNLFCGSSIIIDRKGEDSDQIHSGIKLYKIELSQYYNITDVLLKTLTPHEVQRAHRYHHIKDSKRFIICRSFLKLLIAQRNDIEISQVYFEKTENHKPYFPLDKTLFFNVSHAGDYAIIAIGNCELGVDIEYIDKHFNYADILPTVFSSEELSFVEMSNFKRQTFYKLWTRKEAIVKATGKGIDDDFSKIPVLDGAHTVPSSLINDFKKINVFSFNLNAYYVGAFAFKGDDIDFKHISFQPLPNIVELESLFKL